jgi:hypothetical protein
MSVYLVDHPPKIRQYRCPRRATPSGVIVVHTAESFPDETGPDTGAENVAAFIARRTNFGSYHDLADSDSIIQLVSYSCEAFHDATGTNPHSYGVSAATQAAKWASLGDDWKAATVRNMARAAARYATWIRSTRGIAIPARDITAAQARARVPGFVTHAELDPARRTDPGKGFPWTAFLAAYAHALNPARPTRPTVDLSQLIVAAKHDPARPQGGTTRGARDDVLIVEAALKREGLLAAKYAGDGSYGTMTIKAYAAWQRRCGFSGADADGIPGMVSLKKLGARQGFNVVA